MNSNSHLPFNHNTEDHNGTSALMPPATHRDVGIYGLWYGNNYGSMITYYALFRVIESMGLTCGMVSNPLGSEPDADTLVRSHSLRFARDHYVVSPRYALSDMSNLNRIYDRFVLGSDQMWNIGLSRPYRQSYYLDFADENHPKIAYATSFGREIWKGTEEERLSTMRNLRRFTGISVRDSFSQKILRNQFGIDGTCVIDPVFLCPLEEYQALIEECGGRIPAFCIHPASDRTGCPGIAAESPSSPSGSGSGYASAADGQQASSVSPEDIDLNKERYLFAYILDPDVSIGAGLSQIAEETGLTIFVAFDEGRYVKGEFERVRNALALTSRHVVCLNDITVQEWLSLFAHAQYVLTDSFHGTCFSILFQKPFLVRRNGKRGGGRFNHLLNTFGLTEPMIERSEDYYERFRQLGGLSYRPDYSSSGTISCVLTSERVRCRQWLHDALFLPKAKLPPVTLAAKAISSILEPDRCTGCGACISTCPRDALTLGPDRYGYYIPVIDYDACVNCGLCAKVCPAVEPPARVNASRPETLAFIAQDPDVLYNSSSGGIFPLLANQMLCRGGMVAGAAWSVLPEQNSVGATKEDPKVPTMKHDAAGYSCPDGIPAIPVRHILIDTVKDLSRLQKSKYLQSYMGDIDRQIREELNAGRRVLFTGCPCQVAGLRRFLGKEYDNLIAVDLLCGNAPSAMFFRKYLQESFPQGILDYQFRSKAHGWNANSVRVTLSDGSVQERRGGKEDLYQKAYHSHLMCPPHCENCPYQEAPRYGDLTIGDFWGYTKKDASVDTSKGVSAVLINNEKGRRFLNTIPSSDILWKKSVPFEWLGGNGNALPGRHNWASPMRDEFYRQISEHTFHEAVVRALSPESTAAGKEEKAQKARIRQLERELAQEREKREAAEEALARVECSKSYRFGRAISAPLRKLRRLRKRKRLE